MIVRDSRTPHGRLESSGGPSNYIAMLETIGLGDASYASGSWKENGHRYFSFLAAATRMGYLKPASPPSVVARRKEFAKAFPNKKSRGNWGDKRHNPLLCRPQLHPRTGPGRCLPCKRARAREYTARRRLSNAA